MPRHARLRVAGLPLHVIQRGINRAPCFSDASDYGLYLGLLGELSQVFDCAVHAYVLMTNHVHLLLTPGTQDGPSHLMRHLGVRYVPQFNRRTGRIGPLWNERFKTSVVDSERYLLTCYRYIELNPVRARMVGAPESYPWSSYTFNAFGSPSTFLQPHTAYLGLAGHGTPASAVYRDLVAQGLCDSELAAVRRAINANAALGSEEFMAALEQRLGISARTKPRGRPRKERVPPGGKKSPSPV
jgi:putative transposase